MSIGARKPAFDRDHTEVDEMCSRRGFMPKDSVHSDETSDTNSTTSRESSIEAEAENKGVTFNETVLVGTSTPALTTQEKAAVFYSRVELRTMRQDTYATAQEIQGFLYIQESQQSPPLPPSSSSPRRSFNPFNRRVGPQDLDDGRGLHKFTPRGKSEGQFRVREAVSAVLHEQYRQRKQQKQNDTIDQEAIATVYLEHSTPSQELAVSRGELYSERPTKRKAPIVEAREQPSLLDVVRRQSRADRRQALSKVHQPDNCTIALLNLMRRDSRHNRVILGNGREEASQLVRSTILNFMKKGACWRRNQ